MFNWYAAPAFGAMLLFGLLAAYVLTRSPHGPISLAAVVALLGMASYLLGQGMQLNAATPEEWLPWARGPQGGAPLAAAAWYWLTLLLLREQEAATARGYLRLFGYPLGLLLAAGAVLFTAAIYVDDWLYEWGAPTRLETDVPPYVRYYAPAGRLYGGFVLLVVGAAVGAVINLWLGRRLPLAPDRRRRFGWLLVSAVLFVPEVSALAIAHWRSTEYWPGWLNHLALAAAMALMASNVAAYHRLRHGQVVRTDLLYFLLAWALICAGYALVFVVIGGGYSFRLLGLLLVTLLLLILSHALVDPARRLFDRLLLGSEIEHLRSNLATVAQDAALTPDLDALLTRAQSEIAEVSAEHLVRLTEEALRRLNRPAALAQCGLAARIPRTVAAARGREGESRPAEATPLEQARALREVLVLAIERLKPADASTPAAPGALQYEILREEYVQGLPNKQIMTRHSISEGTFHRNRREAIAILARELEKQESLQSPQ
jgi:hypothetical protein